MATWGGKRAGAGRPPGAKGRKAKRALSAAAVSQQELALPAPKKKPSELSADDWARFLPEIEELSRRYARGKPPRDGVNTAFKFPDWAFPQAALPQEPMQLAMDAELKEVISFNSGVMTTGSYEEGLANEGLAFLGYTYLAELAQRPEYRIMAETIADDSTRHWIEFEVAGEDEEEEAAVEQAAEKASNGGGEGESDAEAALDLGEDEPPPKPQPGKKPLAQPGSTPEDFMAQMAGAAQGDPSEPDPEEEARKEAKRQRISEKQKRIRELEDELLRLEVQRHFYQLSRTDNFFGRAHLFVDIRTTGNLEAVEPDEQEIQTDIGDGKGALSITKIPKGSFRCLKVVEPMWAYPVLYNANNPLRDDWYNPTQWYVMGKYVHQSRLMTFVGHPVPDILKPVYAFGGLSLTQMAKPYVDIWLKTRQSVAELIHAFSVMVLQADLAQQLQPGNAAMMMARVALFNMFRDNQGLFLVNKDSEDLKNVAAPMSGLDHLQAQAQEHMCIQRGTIIETARGGVPIEHLRPDDRVLTRSGYRPIKWMGVTKQADTFVRLSVSDSVLMVTEGHPIWIESLNDFVAAQNVKPSHSLLVLKTSDPENTAHQSLGAVDGGGAPVWAITAISVAADCFIESCGKLIAAQFRKAMKFITGMASAPITTGTISNWSPVPNISKGMAVKAASWNPSTRCVAPYASANSEQRHGARSIALEPAKQRHSSFDLGGPLSDFIRWSAEAVARIFSRKKRELDFARVAASSVSGIETAVVKTSTQGVYDIEVDGPPEFFANSILVHNSSVSRIPLVKFTGISPSGLNATSEFEIEVYDDTIEGYQERVFRANLQRVVYYAMLNIWGEIDEDITFKFKKLRQMTEAEKGQKVKDEAETRQKYVDMGAFSPEEIRGIAINDPDLPFAGLDPEDVPDLRQEEAEGLEPQGGRPQPPGGSGGSEGEGGEGGPPPPSGGGGPKGRDSYRDAGAHSDMTGDAAEFKEGDHPRDAGGKFTAGAGGGGGGPSGGAGKAAGEKKQAGGMWWSQTPGGGYMPALPDFLKAEGGGGWGEKRTNIGKPLSMAGLTKHEGTQMGSNPGAIYEDEDGKKFYIKQGKSPAHVTNEMVAAALYHLAGTATFKYRPVEGGGHIATQMAKLDKDNANKFSEKDRHEAKKDFAVHAWLGNWDAAGLGGDNLGMVKGKPTALDLGGALEFRAQGAPKGGAFGNSVTELDSLRNPSINKDTAKLFGDMTPAELRESARYVTDITDKEIKEAVKGQGGSDALADKLIKRRDSIRAQAETFGAQGDPNLKTSTVVFPKNGPLPVKALNGVAFKEWDDAPDSTRGWANVEGQKEIIEPEFKVPEGKRPGSGLLIQEADGRVWMMRPKGGFGGYEHTFPKGGLEKSLSPQANAIKEAYEESGLKAEITGFAGDHEGDTSFTRYYYAKRTGGDPSKTTWEADGVVLAPTAAADKFLNRSRDRKIASSLAKDEALAVDLDVLAFDADVLAKSEWNMATDAEWKEEDHPRGEGGKFTSGAGGGGGAKGKWDVKKFDDYKDFANTIFTLKKQGKNEAAAAIGLSANNKEFGDILESKYPKMFANWAKNFPGIHAQSVGEVGEKEEKAGVIKEVKSYEDFAGGNQFQDIVVQHGWEGLAEYAKLNPEFAQQALATGIFSKEGKTYKNLQHGIEQAQAAGQQGGHAASYVDFLAKAANASSDLSSIAALAQENPEHAKKFLEEGTMTEGVKSALEFGIKKSSGEIEEMEPAAAGPVSTSAVTDYYSFKTAMNDIYAENAGNKEKIEAEITALAKAHPDFAKEVADATSPGALKSALESGIAQGATPVEAMADAQKPDWMKSDAPFGGLYVLDPTKSMIGNHSATIEKVLGEEAMLGIHYRRMIGQLIKDEANYKTLGPDKLKLLHARLRQSWLKAADKATAKGKHEEAAAAMKKAGEISEKMAKIGGTTAEPAPAAQAPEKPAAAPAGAVNKEKMKLAGSMMRAIKAKDYKQADHLSKQLIAQGGLSQAEMDELEKEHPSHGVPKATMKEMATPESKIHGGVKPAPAEVAKTVKQQIVEKPKPAAAPAKPPEPGKPQPPKFDPPTEQELTKAKKSVPLQMQYVPGAKPEIATGEPYKNAMKMIEAFNAKYANKEITAPDALKAKVDDFKTLAWGIGELAKAENPLKAKMAEEAAAKAKEAKAQQDKANAENMKHPGYAAMAGIMGHNQAKQYMQSGQSVVNIMKKYGVDLSPVEGGLIQSYIGSHYEEMNNQAYSGALDEAQWHYREALVAALSKMPLHKGTAQRGIKHMTAAQWSKYQPGKIIPAVTIQSAGKHHKLWGTYTLNIKNGSARDISMINGEGGGEIVFMPDAAFKVIKVSGNVAEVEQIKGH